MTRVLMLLCAVMCAAETTAAGQAATAFAIGSHRVAPGQRVDFDHPIPVGSSDPATYIPMTVFHGAQPGRTLAITAGVHGYEFPPILAAQELLTRIDPS